MGSIYKNKNLPIVRSSRVSAQIK